MPCQKIMDGASIAIIVIVILIVMLMFFGTGACMLAPATGGLKSSRASQTKGMRPVHAHKSKKSALHAQKISYQGTSNVPHHFGEASFSSAATLHKSSVYKDATKPVNVF